MATLEIHDGCSNFLSIATLEIDVVCSTISSIVILEIGALFKNATKLKKAIQTSTIISHFEYITLNLIKN